MAILAQSLPTLLDKVKRMAPNGAIDNIVEQLTMRNAILEDMVWSEGNLPTGHLFTSRTGLPSVAWRKLNQGVSPGKSLTDQVTETCGMLEATSAVDCEVARLNGNEAAFRASEDNAFLQSLNNEVSTGLFYHSTAATPEKFGGLTPRFNATSSVSTLPQSSQIIKSTASPSGSDQTSIWLVCWGPDTVFGIYPKGTVGGIETEDMGKQLWDDGTGKKFRAWVTYWTWRVGLVVKDWRYVVRIANIDTSAIGATDTTIIEAMIKATHQIQDLKMGRPVFYCNRTVGAYLHLQARSGVTNSTLSIENIGGSPITKFLGIPVRETDALINTEDAVA
jgi:hypothetical protein